MARNLLWAVRLAVAAFLALGWILTTVGQAEAHASLVSTSPSNGESLGTAPTDLILRFDEPVDVGSTGARLFSGAGEVRTLDPFQTSSGEQGRSSSVLRVSLPALPVDQYLIRWSTTTAGDFHQVSGTVAFAVGLPVQAGFSPGGEPPIAPVVESLLRLAVMLALVGAIGGGALLARQSSVLVDRPGVLGRVRDGTRQCARLGAFAMVGLAVFMRLRGGIWPSDRALVALAAAVVGLAAAGVMMGRQPEERRASGLPLSAWTGLVVAAWGIGVLGHGAGQSVSVLPGAAIALVHVLAISAWVGGLAWVTVLVIPALRAGEGAWVRRVLVGFAGVAAPALVVAVVSGLLLASGLVLSTHALTGSSYGLLLQAKLALVGLAGGLGLLTFVDVRRDRRGHAARPTASRRLVVEAWALGGAVLLATVLATVSSPTGPGYLPGEGTPPQGLLSARVDNLLVTARLSSVTPTTGDVRLGVIDTRRPALGPITSVEVRVADQDALVAARVGASQWWVPPLPLPTGPDQTVVVIVHRAGQPDAVATLVGPFAPIIQTGPGGRSLRAAFFGLAALISAMAGAVTFGLVARRRTDWSRHAQRVGGSRAGSSRSPSVRDHLGHPRRLRRALPRPSGRGSLVRMRPTRAPPSGPGRG